jgi:hypothetical protein
MVTYELTAPFSTGTMQNPVTINSLQVTSVSWSSTPALAPLGAQELDITLTDPVSGWQETITYQDTTVGPFWSAALVPQDTLADTVAYAVLTKLQADGKIPTGTISTGSTNGGATGPTGPTGGTGATGATGTGS